MTICVAATSLLSDGRAAFLLAADARASRPPDYSDTAVKTYELDARIGAVGAGDAMACAAAIEMTRGMIRDQNRESSARFTFYNAVRTFSYFLDHVDSARPWSQGCEVVLAGFLQNGRPAIAKIVTRRGHQTGVDIFSQLHCGSIVVFAGNGEAKEQMLVALRAAFAESAQRWVARLVATIAYLGKHEGSPTIGGGVAIGVCRGNQLEWPLTKVGGRSYLRGFDVTEAVAGAEASVGVEAAAAFHLPYDETWHADVDQGQLMLGQIDSPGYASVSRYVNDLVPASTLLMVYDDPPELSAPLIDGAPSAVVVIARPHELRPR